MSIDIDGLYKRMVILGQLDKIGWLQAIKSKIHEELMELEMSLQKSAEEPANEAGNSNEQPVQQPEGQVPAA